MSLWQIMTYRQGWIEANTAKSEEDQAKDAMSEIGDDDFFALMEAEINEGEQIKEDDFILEIKKKGG